MEKINEAKKRMLIPFIMTLVTTVLVAVTVFMPFASASKEFREELLEDTEMDYAEEVGMTNKDVVNISLVKFVRIYAEMANQGIEKEICIICIVMIVSFIVFALIAVILAAFKKPIGVLVFNILAMLSFKLIRLDFKDRGVMPSSMYDWGIANILVYVFGMLTIAAGIWLLVTKIKYKKLLKQEPTIEENN